MEILKRYQAFLTDIDRAFDQAKSEQPEAIPCHAGCSRCCYAIFAVRPIDTALIAWGLAHHSPPNRRDDYLEKCRSIMIAVREFQPEITPGFRVFDIGRNAFDALVEQVRRPCPFLTTAGWCGVYPFRPRICRLAGTLFQDVYSGDLLEDYCPLGNSARDTHGFRPVPFDLTSMYLSVQEFDEAFRSRANSGIRSGYTFPAAGVLAHISALGLPDGCGGAAH